MSVGELDEGKSFAALKAKHRRIRDGFPNELSLRVHRALSWLNRAEMAADDPDAAFLFYWISFNAAYAAELTDSASNDERYALKRYFQLLTSLDEEHLIYHAIWKRFSQSIRLLLENRFVYQPFWKHHNGTPGYEDWQRRFDASKRKVRAALRNLETETVLTTLFDRLYVLRNQLVHGGATWNSSVNRAQVGDGARIMALLVPIFIDLMMNNPDLPWGAPYYPVVD